MKKLVITLLAILITNLAYAENWIKLVDNYKGLTVYLDTDSIKKTSANPPLSSPQQLSSNSKIIKFTVKNHFEQLQQTIAKKKYNEVVINWKGDCINNQLSHLGGVQYNNHSVVDSYTTSLDAWGTQSPQTLGKIELDTACKIAGYRTQP